MFDHLIRQIKKLEEGMSLSIDLPIDDAGYLDRRCPSVECQFAFKVLFEDWREKVNDDYVYCPLCRYEQPAAEWNTQEQTEYIESFAIAFLHETINDAMQEDARRFNRQQKPGFINLSLSVRPGSRPFILPIEAAGAIQQRLACESCGCRYAVVGAAFFCPACGHNSVITTFDQTIETVHRVIGQIASVRQLLIGSFDEDTAHNSTRTMIEDSITRLVGAFQQFSEALFNTLQNASNIRQRKNVFQNLAESSALWRNATGKGYEDLLTASELHELGELFQRRHLIAHRNGIVDQEYIDKSGDRTYAIGQRLVIKETTVLRLANLLAKLSSELRTLT